MAGTPTARLKLPIPAESDPADIPVDLGKLATALDSGSGGLGAGSGVAIDGQGTFSQRPAAGVQGRYFYATDRSTLYRDNGTTWITITPEILSALPASTPPYGQLALIQIPSPDVPIQWQLHSNGTSWDFTGGPSMRAEVAAATVFNSATWNATGSPQLQVPLSGYYDITLGAAMSFNGQSGTSGNATLALYDVAAGTPNTALAALIWGTPGGGAGASVVASYRRQLVKGTTYAIACSTNNQSVYVVNRFLELRPVGGFTS